MRCSTQNASLATRLQKTTITFSVATTYARNGMMSLSPLLARHDRYPSASRCRLPGAEWPYRGHPAMSLFDPSRYFIGRQSIRRTAAHASPQGWVRPNGQ
jgi:hypothetical protein